TSPSGCKVRTESVRSTVKHLNWPIPDCIRPGSYNITLYETSHIAGSQFFSITPIPATIENPLPSGPCSPTNEFFAGPQSSSPPPANPFLNTNAFNQITGSVALFATQQTSVVSSASTSSTSGPVPQAMTVTLGAAGAQWPMTVMPPDGYGPVVLETSGYNPTAVVTITGIVEPGTPTPGGGNEGTVTVVVTPTFAPTPITVVLVSMDTETVTTTVSGETSVFTTT
ncbi:uncharacterized protein PHACADRAFT_83918, partial [Phanerochaete carnosa HHB-10118-sp]